MVGLALLTTGELLASEEKDAPHEGACLQIGAFSGGCSKMWEWRAPHGTYHVHYVERGSGSRHVLLIHGFSANTFSWRSIVEPLAAAGMHIWALDLIGFGQSAKPSDAPYCFDLYVDQVRSFIEAMGIQSPNLVGHSMGGCVVLGVAMRVPHLLGSITLVDSIGYPQELPWLVKLSRGLGDWLSPLLSRTTVAHLLRSTLHGDDELDDEVIDAYWLPLSADGGKLAAIKVLQAFDNSLFEKMSLGYRSIDLPCLVIWGQRDDLVPVAHAYQFHRDLKRSHLRVLLDAGHSPQEESPEEFCRSLVAFLRRYSQDSKDPNSQEEQEDLPAAG